MVSMIQFVTMAASATQVAASCAYGTHLSPRAAGGVSIKEFGYFGNLGPANWHSMNITQNHICATGLNQSPIDFTSGTYKVVSGANMIINIPDFKSGAVFENIGTAVEVVGAGGNLTLPGGNKTFNFAQFHFHLPSEHLDNGTAHAMEVHMVFQAEDSELAVLGTYIDITSNQSKADKMLTTLFSSVNKIATPGTATTTAPLTMSNVVSKLKATTFKSYSGSLTTPPCAEGVNWFVAEGNLLVTVDTWNAARNVIGFNSRYAQSAPGQVNALTHAFDGVTAIKAAGLS